MSHGRLINLAPYVTDTLRFTRPTDWVTGHDETPQVE